MIESKDLIEATYGIKVTSIKPCRAGYVLETEKGKKHLRQCQCSENRILYVHGAKEHLFNNGFVNLDTYSVTVNNKPFMEIEGQNSWTPFFEARECEFSDDTDTIRASTALAQMHIAGIGFKHEYESISGDLGKLPESLGKRYDEILRMRRKAERERGAFDYIYLDCVDKFIELAEESLSLLGGTEYPRLVKKTFIEGGICHHDYSYQNILLKGIQPYYGFECCTEELRIYDLVNLLRRKCESAIGTPKASLYWMLMGKSLLFQRMKFSDEGDAPISSKFWRG